MTSREAAAQWQIACGSFKGVTMGKDYDNNIKNFIMVSPEILCFFPLIECQYRNKFISGTDHRCTYDVRGCNEVHQGRRSSVIPTSWLVLTCGTYFTAPFPYKKSVIFHLQAASTLLRLKCTVSSCPSSTLNRPLTSSIIKWQVWVFT